MSLFNVNLKRIRKERGIKQAEMAEKTGVSLRMYQRYEKDITPGMETIKLLGEILGYDFLKDETDTTKNVVPDYRDELIALYKQLHDQKNDYSIRLNLSQII